MIYNICQPKWGKQDQLTFYPGPAIVANSDEEAVRLAKQLGFINPILKAERTAPNDN